MQNQRILTKIDFWSDKEIYQFILFCKNSKKDIIGNLEANIMRIKPTNIRRGFFKDMATYISSKNSNQCKSKYQKFKKKIIIDFLKEESLYLKFEDHKKNIKNKKLFFQIEQNNLNLHNSLN